MNHSISLRARFRGALLGLWLAPTAMALGTRDRSGAESSTPLAAKMAQLLVPGFEWIDRYSVNPDAFQLSSSPESGHPGSGDLKPRSMPCWLASVPVLLRYHDSRVRRSRWLSSQAMPLQALADANGKSWAVAQAQIELLGDFMEMTLCAKGAPLLSYWPNSGAKLGAKLGANADESYGLAEQLSKALTMPCSYGQAVQRCAIQDAGYPITDEGDLALMIGFLAGALLGEGGLPVLWQLGLGTGPAFRVSASEGNASEGDASEGNAFEGDASEGCASEGCVSEGDASGARRTVIVDIAERLFGQWAGVGPAALNLQAKGAQGTGLPTTAGRVSGLFTL